MDILKEAQRNDEQVQEWIKLVISQADSATADKEKSGEAETSEFVSLRRLSKEKERETKKKAGDVFAREICLFAPSTLDRLKSVVPRLAQTWSGTMSVAVLASEEEVTREIFASNNQEFTRERLTVIAVEPLPVYKSRFPVNALRNLALI